MHIFFFLFLFCFFFFFVFVFVSPRVSSVLFEFLCWRQENKNDGGGQENSQDYSVTLMGVRTWVKPFVPSGPCGGLMRITRGPVSSVKLFKRLKRRSGRRVSLKGKKKRFVVVTVINLDLFVTTFFKYFVLLQLNKKTSTSSKCAHHNFCQE